MASNYQSVGYIRVSSLDQNTARQLIGINLDKIFEEKVSGKDRKRPALERKISYIREGDHVYVHSMDRLARNLRDLLDLVRKLQKKAVPFILLLRILCSPKMNLIPLQN